MACYTRLDCPVDAVCHNGDHLCKSLECRSHRDCADRPLTPYCLHGICQADPPPQCQSRSQCGVGEACKLGECVEVAEAARCSDNEDCGNPLVCDPYLGTPGACFRPCSRHSDCEQYSGLRACEPSSGFCQPVECLEDIDCGYDEVCTPDYFCEPELSYCPTLICQGTDRPFKTEPIDDMCRCVQCLSDNHCSQIGLEVCTERRRCLYCEVAAEEATDCPSEHPFFQEGCCLDCLEEDDCQHMGLGSICSRGRCIPCNCLAGCACPVGSTCQTTENPGQGVCMPGQGGEGDACLAQPDCQDGLACSYATGRCVEEATGSFCSEAGCPEPSRCASRTEGALCYGCGNDQECPDTFFCYIPAQPWEYEGGLCLPGE
ncbi:MAG: hypothetical protein JW797_16870 [Bradymonadales bacterium]|nr:hypothetical protein [Bradymonadales bacterium]